MSCVWARIEDCGIRSPITGATPGRKRSPARGSSPIKPAIPLACDPSLSGPGSAPQIPPEGTPSIPRAFLETLLEQSGAWLSTNGERNRPAQEPQQTITSPTDEPSTPLARPSSTDSFACLKAHLFFPSPYRRSSPRLQSPSMDDYKDTPAGCLSAVFAFR